MGSSWVLSGRVSFAFVLCGFLGACSGVRERIKHWYLDDEPHEHAAHWSYSGETGPAHWGELTPEYELAKSGSHQSPINIDSSAAIHEELPDIEVRYRPEKAVFVNNGHALQHDEGDGSELRFQGRRYRLVQFHFHTPSEHTIDGNRAPGEIHLVHLGEQDELLVLAVLLRQGEGRPELEAAAESFPDKAGETASLPILVNPSLFLDGHRGYFSYEGSLTTPPCTEGVRWIVMREELEVPAAVLERVRAITGANNRPVQPLHDREVRVR